MPNLRSTSRDRAYHRLVGSSRLENAGTALFLLAALLMPAWCNAVNLFDESATFKTQAGQSQFGSQTQITVGQDQFLGFEFDTGEVRFGHIEEISVLGVDLGSFGGAATIDVSGRFGLETGYEFSSGNLDISLPHSVQLDIDNPLANTATLTPGFMVGTGADNFFQTEFPSFTFDSALVAELDASVKIDACIFGCFLNGQEIIPAAFRGIDERLPLLGYASADNTFSVFGVDIDENILGTTIPVGQGLAFPTVEIPLSLGPPPVQATIDVSVGQKPNTPFEAAESSITQVIGGVEFGNVGTDLVTLRFAPPGQKLNVDQQLAPTGDLGGPSMLNQDVASLSLDVDALATGIGLLPVPLGATISVGEVDFTADILDLQMGPAIGLGQNIDFQSNPTLTLDFERPVLVNGQVVSSIDVDPRGGVPLTVEVDREVVVHPSFNLDPKVTNEIDLTVRTQTTLDALKFKLAVANQTIFETDPLFTKEFGDLSSPPEPLLGIFSGTFDLANANADIGALPSFKIADGLILAGQDAANSRAPTTQNGSISSYHIDYKGCAGSGVIDGGDVNCGLKDVDIAVFAGPDRDIRVSLHSVPGGFEGIFARVGDLAQFDALTEPATVAVGPENTLTPAALPSPFQDSAVTFNLFGAGTIHNSDAVTIRAGERSTGLGLDSSVFLSFDLLRDGANGELLFAEDIGFSFGADPELPYGNPGERLLFESLAFDGVQLHGLLGAIGDTDGLNLSVGSGAQAVTFNVRPDVLNGALTGCGGVFNLGANGTCVFNFADDFVNKNLIIDNLMLAQGFDASTGVGAFNISDFDVNLGDNSVGTLLAELGGLGADPSSLSIGISFDELAFGTREVDICTVVLDPGAANFRQCTPLDLQRTDTRPDLPNVRQLVVGADEIGLGGIRRLTDATVDAEVLASHVFVPPPPVPPVPDPPLPTTFDPVVAKKSGGTCVAVAANGEPDCGETGAPVVINITTIDPATGQAVTQPLAVADFLANKVPNAPPPVPPEVPVPGLVDGLVSTNGLSPTDLFGNTFVYDFDNVAGWGDPQTYTQRVFRGNNFLSDGITRCSDGVGNVTDGQVVGQSPGANSSAPVLAGIDLRGNSARSVAGCFESVQTDLVFGEEAPVFLEFPFAPVLDFDIDGPKFTSVTLPGFGGDNALLLNALTVSVLDEVVGTLAPGGVFEFATPVESFLLAGLDINRFLLDDNPGFIDEALRLVFGLTVDDAGTIISVTASAPLSSAAPEPGTGALVLAGLLLLMGRRRRRLFR